MREGSKLLSVSVTSLIFLMGYLGYFYVECKSFEIRYGVGNVRFAEKSKGIFLAVGIGFQSLVWLVKTMEVMIKEDNLKEFCRSFRVGDIVYIVQKRQNNHGKFLELADYGVEGGEVL